MRIVATLTVHEDADILDAWFQHYLQAGVGPFLVTDHRSSAATLQILSRYRDVIAGYWREENPAYQQSEWVSRMAREAVNLAPDWVVHLDADEFWTGFELLAHVSSETLVVRTGPWRNHLPLEGLSEFRCNPADLPYYEIPGRTGRHRPRFALDGMGNGGKIVHRPIRNVIVGMGNHCLHVPTPQALLLDELEVHHYPVRSLAHFRRKSRNGAQSLRAAGHAPELAGHWRRWDAADDSQLAVLYEQLLVSDQEIVDRLADGTMFRRTPADVLR